MISKIRRRFCSSKTTTTTPKTKTMIVVIFLFALLIVGAFMISLTSTTRKLIESNETTSKNTTNTTTLLIVVSNDDDDEDDNHHHHHHMVDSSFSGGASTTVLPSSKSSLSYWPSLIMHSLLRSSASTLLGNTKNIVLGSTSSSTTRKNDNAGEEQLKDNMTTSTTTIMQQQQEQGQRKLPLDPMQVFEEYKQYHSVDVLNREIAQNISISYRKYVIVRYSCPHQAGMQLTDFLNSVGVAVSTNRTMLFQYGGILSHIRNGENAEEYCNRIIQLQNWVPRYEDYKIVLGISNMKPIGLHLKLLEEPEDHTNEIILHVPRLWSHGGLRAYMEHKVLNVANEGVSEKLSKAFGISPPLHEQERIKKLYGSEGPIFTHGMYFRMMYTYTPELLSSVKDDIYPTVDPTTRDSQQKMDDVDNGEIFSIGIHSRHASKDNDGSNIDKEIKCINKLLLLDDEYNSNINIIDNDSRRAAVGDNTTFSSTKKRRRKCIIYIMSDRPNTVQAIRDYATTTSVHNCIVISTTQPIKTNIIDITKINKTDNIEHGPYAGMGYFQDTIITSQTQTAYISKFRSSSIFPYEQIEYNRRIYAWQKYGTRQMKNILTCHL